MWQEQTRNSSFRESIKSLEADIQHANALAAALPQDNDGDYVQMKLNYSPFAPFLIFLIEWMDYSCTDTLPSYLGLLHILVYKVYVDGMPMMSVQERKATLKEFYAVIYPSLKLLEENLTELVEENSKRTKISKILGRKSMEEKRNLSNADFEGGDECGICMEACTKMVMPNCGHSMCIRCYDDWNERSPSCPFCRGSLNAVSSSDLWVLTSKSDAVDAITLAKENLRCFYLYIENLPLIVPDIHMSLYEYLS